MKILRSNYLHVLALALVSGAFLMLTSCSKDDDDSDISVEGTWTLQSVDYDGSITSEVAGQPFSSNFDGEARDITGQLDLKSDGTYTSSGKYTIDMTYQVFGQTVTSSYEVDEFIGSGTYEVSGDQLIAMDGQGNTTEATIDKATDNELVLSFESSRDTTDNGVTTTVTIDGVYSFTK